MASESKSANAVCFKSMDLYNNDRSYFIERVIQNCFEDGFEGEHPFKTHRCLDIMSYTRIDSSQHSFPSDYPFTPKIQTPEDLKETLGCSDHELNILEYALPQHKKAPDVEGVAMLDVGCGYGGIARMLKIRYPHIKVSPTVKYLLQSRMRMVRVRLNLGLSKCLAWLRAPLSDLFLSWISIETLVWLDRWWGASSSLWFAIWRAS